jgi:pyridoxine 5-phosphate synthase
MTTQLPYQRLYVNVDHVATLRQARRGEEPDPVAAALLCELAGADGITVHLREDRRHIQDRDVERLVREVRTVVNLEMANTPEMVDKALLLLPHQVTFVPERREEITTEGGLDLSRAKEGLSRSVQRLRSRGIRVSLFIDPEPESVELAAALAADAVELHTGRYCQAPGEAPRLAELARAARQASALNLAVHAGHGLTARNVRPVAAIPEIEELNIGHSIISRAVFVGMEAAVREVLAEMRSARGWPVQPPAA